MTRAWRSTVAGIGVSVLLAVAYLLAPPLGTDLSAQVARADFFSGHGLTPIDLRWYGGVNQFGYSLVSQVLMGTLGVRTVAVLSLVIAAVAFAVLLVRVDARRPILGSIAGTVCIAGNLASGRVTYGLGVAFGLLALLALTSSRNSVKYAGAAVAALLASVTSPVAGLFVGLAGVALFLARRRWEGTVLAVCAAAGVGLTGLLFGEGGVMNISGKDAATAILASLTVAALATHVPVRIGALVSAAGVTAAFLIDTPVGLNATRLATMFALPVLVATARLPSWFPRVRHPGWHRAELAILVLMLAFVAPPVVLADLGDTGNPASTQAYYAPLAAALQARGAGRVEVVPTRNYWEAAYVAPLARGWLRQVDLARNPIFFEQLPGGRRLTPENYLAWLRDNGVGHVALSDASLSWLAKPEAALIRTGLPYLTEVWRGEHWRLFAVAGTPTIVDGLVSANATSVTFDAPAAGEVLIRVRYSRWLTLLGGNLKPDPDGWTIAEVPGPGRYALTS